MGKTKTYMDRLMDGKEFREKFEQEYQNLCIGEHIAKAHGTRKKWFSFCQRLITQQGRPS